MRSLLSFDYVIEHPDLPWLPTEAEKVAAFGALDIGGSLLPVRVYRGAAGGTRRYFRRGMPVALDSLRTVFVHAGPGYGTSTVLRSWQDRHVGVAGGTRELKRARTILGNWVGPAPAQKANRQARTATAVQREVVRVENAIRRRNEAVIEELGGLNGCLHRLVGMKALL